MTKPPRPPLTSAMIIQAAIALIHRDGLERLSMRALALELRVDPMAVYYHLPNKAALLHAVYDTVLGELFVPQLPGGPWRQRLEALAHRYRAVAVRHHSVFRGLISSGDTPPNERRALDYLLTACIEADLSPQSTIQAADTLFSYVTGFALIETKHMLHPEVNTDLARPGGPERLPAERLIGMLPEHPFADSFEYGLQAVLSGIEALRPA
ncbi:TetR/AcrR family transcriptional regulator [Deinococcus altitudinis]|uniref:TetR/AcrR family transcriptional regulator n=1 Tax=Deinococcus altitudinis TaxID=468914 RepID=UPI0038923316